MPQVKGRMVQTYLDEIEAGTDEMMEAEQAKPRSERKKLPEGCKEKTLYGDVFRIAWPSLVELTLTSLSSMVDMMMVGSIGTDAISAVGLATQPRFIFMTLVMALNTGATAVVARARGAGNHDQANQILKQALLFTTVLAIFSSIMGYIFSPALIRFMAAGGMAEETIGMGVDYLRVQFVGFITMALGATITAALRGSGNSRVPMVYNMVANVVNVIGNYCLIYGKFGFPELGVTGASIATVFGQAVACVMAFISVTNGKNYFHLHFFKEKFRIDFKIIGAIANVGVPALIEQMIMRVGMILFNRTVASLSETAYATHQVCMNIQSLSMMNGQAFAVSATSLVGQSLGKKRSDMAEHYSRRCRRLGLYVSLFLLLVFGIFGRQLVSLYNTDPDVLRMGAMIMVVVALMQPIQCSQFVTAGALRGAGDTRATAIISLITVLALRPTIAWLAVNVLDFGILGAWGAMFIDQVIRSLLVISRYNSGKWKKIKVNLH